MRAINFITESAVDELADQLPTLKRTDYDAIDALMQRISAKHDLTGEKLHQLFVSKYGHTPDTWVNRIKQRNEDATANDWRSDAGKKIVAHQQTKIDATDRSFVYQGYSIKFTPTSLDIYKGPDLVYQKMGDYSDPNKLNLQVARAAVEKMAQGWKWTPPELTHPEPIIYKATIQNGYEKEDIRKVQVKAKAESEAMKQFKEWARKRRIPSPVITIVGTGKPRPAAPVTEGVDTPEDEKKVLAFIDWSMKTLHIQEPHPKFNFSRDTTAAQKDHRTGLHTSDGSITIYIENRNLVDIFRTIFHELVHHRQDQLGMIKDGDSYPGSPVEAMADMMAGKYIKIYGKQHPEIFQ